MSGAHVTNMQMLRRAKKIRSPEDAKFMKMFGATDVYLNSSQGLEGIPVDGWNPGLSPDSFVPLSDDLVMPADYAPLWDPSEMPPKKETQKVESAAMSPETKDQLIQANGTNNDQVDELQGEEEVDELVSFFGDAGFTVGEVKTLPSGTTRITLEDLFGPMQAKEREFARLGG
ncbi:MAG: hypothetical protein SWQ30_12790 [Thermodesulfobacteriota bacterium]|nr:hypothetical protein [Thermodesulfobacteriota bacterium]